jgi:hypothetical protein
VNVPAEQAMAEENWGSGASTTSKDPYGQLKVLRSPLIPIASTHIPTIRNLIPTIRTPHRARGSAWAIEGP